jgi:uncharacterized protein
MTGGQETIAASSQSIRRLAVTKQHLAGGVRRKPNSASILRLIRDLGCVQLDPINVVAPSHLIVLWSRLGAFDPSEFEALLWMDHSLFEYWGHQASVVLTEDYPLYYGMMRRVPGTLPGGSWPKWDRRVERWLRSHTELKEYVMRELERRGPLQSREFGHPSASKRKGSGWGSSGDLSEMLQALFLRGQVMVAGRVGRQRVWDLPHRCLPNWVARKELSHDEVEYQAVQRSLAALGIASAFEIRYHFLRHRYPNLQGTLKRLLSESKVCRVVNSDRTPGPERYILRKDLPLLEAIERGDWEPRTTLLSPFDNLICDRSRTENIFDFRFRFEGYVPKGKRQYGPYALPILHGDRLIGRIDPLLDRRARKLLVKGVHAEKDTPMNRETARGIQSAIDSLAAFLGATETGYTGVVPAAWKSVLS